jgi:predicted DNA-binding transcriptional regulator AlpA
MKHKSTHRWELPDISKLPNDALVRGEVADAMFGISRATRWRRAQAGTFPHPRKIGGRMARYVMGELRAQARKDAGATP